MKKFRGKSNCYGDLIEYYRIKRGFSRDDIQIVHTKEELLELLAKDKTNSVVVGLLSSGDFNGLTTDDLKDIYSES